MISITTTGVVAPSLDGLYNQPTKQVMNTYEAWNGEAMEGVELFIGKFQVGDYERLWR